MKKGVKKSGKNFRGVTINIHLTNRWLYTLVFVGVLLIIGVGVYATQYANTNPLTPGTAPNPGHTISQIAPPSGCGPNQILIWTNKSNSNGGWNCTASLTSLSVGAGVWNTTSGGIYYDGGNVGIGTTSPSKSLQVNGLILGNEGLPQPSGCNSGVGGFSFSQDGCFDTGMFSSGDGDLRLYANNVLVEQLSPSQVTFNRDVHGQNFYASGEYLYSDRRLKMNITNLDEFQSLQNLEKLQGVSFNWKSNGEPDIGFIAQDVQKVYPNLVSSTGANKTLALNYVGLISPIVESIKAQQQEITSLQLQVDSLQQQLNDLKSKN